MTTEIIESFESATGNVYGDLLTEQVVERPLRIGLLTLGFFEYWRMYPETLKAGVISDMESIYDQLRKHLPDEQVIWPGLVDTLDTAESAGRKLAAEQVDLIVYVAGTYCPDYMAIQALEHVREAPLLLFNTQSDASIDLNTNYENILRNTSLIASMQLAATFRKMGWYRKLKVVVGTLNDQDAYTSMAKYINSYKAYAQLKRINIGVIGHVFRGMYDFEYDKTAIKGTLGPNVIAIQVDHLLKQYSEASETDITRVSDEAKKRFQIVDVSEEDIRRSANMYVALNNTLQRFRLDALTLLGQHYVEQKTGATSYLANTLLHEENRLVVNTEGDIHGLIVMLLLQKLSNQMPTFAEWGKFDEQLNALLMVHHGYANPNYARDPEQVKVNRSPEQWGLQGSGFGFEYTLREGEVTVSHLIIDEEGYKLLIMKGQSLPVPANIPCQEITAVIGFEMPIRSLLQSLIKEGFSHHCILAYGDWTEELCHIADFLNIRKVIYNGEGVRYD